MHEHHHHEHDIQEPAKLKALLTYMLGHNKHHADELHDAAHELEHHGKAEAAALLHEATAKFAEGNEKLEKALALLAEEE